MTDSYAVRFDDSSQQDRFLGNRNAGDLQSTDNWEQDCFSVDGSTVTIRLARVNEVPDCDGENGTPDCYSFDPTRAKMRIIYSHGDELVDLNGHEEQGGALMDPVDNAGLAPECSDETETPQPTADEETSSTMAPSVSPTTRAPTTEYEACGAAVLLGRTVSIGRKRADETVAITMTAPDDLWFGFGFGNSAMEGVCDCHVCMVCGCECVCRLLRGDCGGRGVERGAAGAGQLGSGKRGGGFDGNGEQELVGRGGECDVGAAVRRGRHV